MSSEGFFKVNQIDSGELRLVYFLVPVVFALGPLVIVLVFQLIHYFQGGDWERIY